MKPRLLATDPDPILLDIWRAYFLNFGFDVVTAVDGMHCVALLREFVPDVMILSFELGWGGADGVLSIVRDDKHAQPIPVVLTTDRSNLSKAVGLLIPPVVKLIEKPLQLEDLRAGVEAALARQSNPPQAGNLT
jgi:DNA-binding response OmpR family regulator